MSETSKKIMQDYLTACMEKIDKEILGDNKLDEEILKEVTDE